METGLPTQKLKQCAYQLNGATLDPTRLARIFVGEGVAGGSIPGKELQCGGILGQGVVPDRTFPYYPFIGFSTLETNLANVAGTYNQLGYHEIPSQNYARISVDSKITINADGTWQECDNTSVNADKYQQAGSNFTQSPDGSGAFVTNNFLGRQPDARSRSAGQGHMIVGQAAWPERANPGAHRHGERHDHHGHSAVRRRRIWHFDDVAANRCGVGVGGWGIRRRG